MFVEETILACLPIDGNLLDFIRIFAEVENDFLRTLEGELNPCFSLYGFLFLFGDRKREAISRETIAEFIETLNVSEDVKEEMRAITPHNYTGR